MDQIVQVAGALLILTGYAANQFGKLGPHSLTYLLLNAAGSAILAVLGYVERQWGFFLLESVWAVVSFWGLYRHFGSPISPTLGPRLEQDADW